MQAADLRFRMMVPGDIDAVFSIEQQVHTHPWTRGMLLDSLSGGHHGYVLEQTGQLLGYAILMPVLDEVHLLDIAIAKDAQQQGFGLIFLNKINEMEIDRGAVKMLLEVRRSNLAAQALYRKNGYHEIGVRRGYYPAAAGREDAIVMERALP